MRRSQVEKREKNFPEQNVPEKWHGDGGGDWHLGAAVGIGVWSEQSSCVFTDERLINLFKVPRGVRGRTGLG